MLVFYMQESKELVLPNLDVYTNLLFSLIFFFFLRKKKIFCSCLDFIIIFIFLIFIYVIHYHYQCYCHRHHHPSFLTSLLQLSPPPSFTAIVVTTTTTNNIMIPRGGNLCSRVKLMSCRVMSIWLYGLTRTQLVY